MKTSWFVCGGLALVAIGVSTQVQPHQYREGRSQDPLLRVSVNQSSLARILGEFRTGMSDMLFIKTERYLHSGVGYVPHLTEELLTVQGTEEGVEEHLEEMGDHGHHHEGDHDDHFHHEEDVETLVPAASQDYRGWIGQMHREVKPWLDPSIPHQHTDGKELIPWFRMMTLSDPGYIRGYIVGAFWLEQHDLEAALEFIDEGLAENSDAFQLHLSKGTLLLHKARRMSPDGTLSVSDPDQQEILYQAKDAFHRSAELMLSVRPPEPEEGEITDLPSWGRYLEADAFAATNFSYLFEQRYGEPAEAERLRRRYLEVMPNHSQLKR